MTTKELLHKIADELPEEADLSEVIDRLLYLQGIERGLSDVKAGRTISHEELLKRVQSWRK